VQGVCSAHYEHELLLENNEILLETKRYIARTQHSLLSAQLKIAGTCTALRLANQASRGDATAAGAA